MNDDRMPPPDRPFKLAGIGMDTAVLCALCHEKTRNATRWHQLTVCPACKAKRTAGKKDGHKS